MTTPFQHQSGMQRAFGHSLSRRSFLRGSIAAAASAGLAQVGLAAVRPGIGTSAPRDVILSIYLRGGMDGLSAVVPFADPDYGSQRQNLAIDGPGPGSDRVLDLDGFFGLNPTGAPLLTPYQDGKLLFVPASGITAPNRSHFDAQRRMETASPDGAPSPGSSGWLGRHLATTDGLGGDGIRGLATSNLLPVSLVGGPGTVPARNIGNYDFPGRSSTRASRRRILEEAYAQAAPWLRNSAANTLGTVDLLQSVDYANYVEAPLATYPQTTFGNALRQVAALIKSGTPLEIAQINFGGWDHHSNLGPLDGQFAAKFNELSQGLEAFYQDLVGTSFGYVALAQTEFGRRIEPNGSSGTDHGFGGCMFVMGPSVLGGRVLTNWPGLAPAASVNGDLAVTTDWRDIAAEVLAQRAGATTTSLATVFPNHTPNFQGVIAP